MIGQGTIQNKLIKMLNGAESNRAVIIVAPKGYGKKELIKTISKRSNIAYNIYENNIDSIKKLIIDSQQDFNKKIYAIDEIEKNAISQNACLKVLEDTPQNIFLFLLVSNKQLLLPTILNRCLVLEMEQYSKEELSQFNNNFEAQKITQVPAQLLALKGVDTDELIKNVDKILDKLDLASISNALKLSTLIKTKESDDGYDLDLFINTLKKRAFDKYKDTKNKLYLNKYNLLCSTVSSTITSPTYFMNTFIIDNYMRYHQWK